MNNFKLLNVETRTTKVIDIEDDYGFGIHKFKVYKSYDLNGNPIPGIQFESVYGKRVDGTKESDIMFTEWIKENVK